MLLHFIYLVVFLSMLAEGVLHGRMVLLPLNRNPIAKKMLIAVWGMLDIFESAHRLLVLTSYAQSHS